MSQNKNGDDIWGNLYREPMEITMNDIKKSKNISGEAHIQSSNANARVLLNLLIFWLVFIIFIIPGRLVLDDCPYASPERPVLGFGFLIV